MFHQADQKAIPFLCMLICVAASLVFAGEAVAQNKKQCDAAVTTRDMIDCANGRYKAADRRLNDVYKTMIKDADAQGIKLLRHAQRSWVAFRDAECLYQRDMARGGTMAPLLQISCLADLTEKRVKDLKNAGEGLAGRP